MRKRGDGCGVGCSRSRPGLPSCRQVVSLGVACSEATSCPGCRLSPTALTLPIARPGPARRRPRPGRSGQSELDDDDDALPANWLMSHGRLCPSRFSPSVSSFSPLRARSRLSQSRTALKRSKPASTLPHPHSCSRKPSWMRRFLGHALGGGARRTASCPTSASWSRQGERGACAACSCVRRKTDVPPAARLLVVQP
jgi:hypothetical protein